MFGGDDLGTGMDEEFGLDEGDLDFNGENEEGLDDEIGGMFNDYEDH
jgi:hypothetical protein